MALADEQSPVVAFIAPAALSVITTHEPACTASLDVVPLADEQLTSTPTNGAAASTTSALGRNNFKTSLWVRFASAHAAADDTQPSLESADAR
ncbi:hypothetical protein GCM10011591_33590 [Nocardia camponoti]|uniref:Uncharacterized protein n=1 Tax=Nocardia camponoti TaxID=1616106 RepID=A0A917QM85_9NOCA|nr:hypothetical protein GCM10011591_33590 [Nocardia camponoti]